MSKLDTTYKTRRIRAITAAMEVLIEKIIIEQRFEGNKEENGALEN